MAKGLLDDVFNGANNAITGGNPPEHTIVPLDSGTNQLIDASIARGQQTPEQFAAQQNQGVSEAANQAYQTPQKAAQADAGMGYSGGEQSINNAIRNQYRSQSGATINRLKDTYDQNAVFQKSAALQQASAEAMARQNVTTQSYARLMDAYNQTEAARAQVLNSILGAGGMAAGGYAASNRGKKKPAAVEENPSTPTDGFSY